MSTTAAASGQMPAPVPLRDDAAVIGLVGLAHASSHFAHLLLPPLFPWLMKDFGLSFTGIGATMTVFFVISGIGQAVSGFLVDRLGAARVLGAGIGCFLGAALLLSLADGYAMLMLVAALAGMAGVSSAGRALPPPTAASPRGAASAAGAGVAGAGAFCTVPVAAPTGAPIVPCAAAGRFQASAVVISRAAGTVRRMR